MFLDVLQIAVSDVAEIVPIQKSDIYGIKKCQLVTQTGIFDL
ncbi:hypothetical protein SAMN04487906_0043 [Zhouia amylolytica]|uniref:Uncharacterized protein n=2 Tax=Zhouia amylolytica TaxID=376730 RepID=W2UIW2_9FLAO|nr:hypothetical protein P278_32840 [Zhouia amylolytica AD3]SFS33532.1 hypothetical protein SAMN04487906_0043 [Zhouia amylolytica]